MKKIALAITLFGAATLTACGGSETETDVSTTEAASVSEDSTGASGLESLEAKVSYLFGFSNIQQLKNQGVEVDGDAFSAGVAAALADVESAIGQEEAQQVFAEYQAKMQSEAQVEFDKAAVDNLTKSEAFLAENATKEDVVTTESGLQYKVLEAGEGDKPTADSQVQVHYEGRLISGDVFDSSIARGTPVEFKLNQVIAGWTEGLQLMPEGSKYEFYIPSGLAYGPGGSRSIGPNEALIFVVELIQANFVEASE